MAKFTLNGYDSYSGCDIAVTARLNQIIGAENELEEKVYTLGSLQTLSVSTHQDKKPVRVIGSVNALDYTMGQRTIAGSLVFAVFDQHFATEMFNDLSSITGKTFFLPDELPGIDLTVTFANEYGRTSRMAIYGVRIINEGQVMSINDLFTENTYQFVATAMEPLNRGERTNSSGAYKKPLSIQSVSNNKDDNKNTYGEDIYYTISGYDNNYKEKINLTAIVEQPSYNESEGLVKFYLTPEQTTGSIKIFDRKKDKVVKDIEISQSIKHYPIFLLEGLYSAWYENKEQVLSNTVDFNILNSISTDTTYNDTPTIEHIDSNSVLFISNNPTHTIGVATNKNTLETTEKEIRSRNCLIEGLKADTEYYIQTKSADSYSNNALIKTTKEDFLIANEFKKYVDYNKGLLSKNFSEYTDIINKITNDDFISVLSKEKSEESKELMFMAIKYKNEYVSIINRSNFENIPIKKADNIFGNTFKFKTGMTKANIFVNRNKKDYFESSELYPTEIKYIGKSNTLYNAVGITNDYSKTPKYYFYSYSDNDKNRIIKSFGKANVLNNIDIYKQKTNSKLSVNNLKCLTAADSKAKDIDLLKAPNGYIDEKLNLIVNVKYNNILGELNNEYFLCISKLDETLDDTPIRKIKIKDWDTVILVDNYLTAINDEDTFALWIEDNSFNIISDLGFVSNANDIYDLNNYLINNEIDNIIRKVELSIKKPGYLSALKLLINIEETSLKDLFQELIKATFIFKEEEAFVLINELLKIQFQNICINKEKYKIATYDSLAKTITFENAENVQLVHIAARKDDYNIDIINSNKTLVNDKYDINIFYVISNNPVIKSGYVIFNNKQWITHSIRLEEK